MIICPQFASPKSGNLFLDSRFIHGPSVGCLIKRGERIKIKSQKATGYEGVIKIQFVFVFEQMVLAGSKGVVIPEDQICVLKILGKQEYFKPAPNGVNNKYIFISRRPYV